MEKPVVVPRERENDHGLFDLDITPFSAIRRFYSHLENERKAGHLNICPPSGGDVTIRLALGYDLKSVIEPFATVAFSEQQAA